MSSWLISLYIWKQTASLPRRIDKMSKRLFMYSIRHAKCLSLLFHFLITNTSNVLTRNAIHWSRSVIIFYLNIGIILWKTIILIILCNRFSRNRSERIHLILVRNMPQICSQMNPLACPPGYYCSQSTVNGQYVCCINRQLNPTYMGNSVLKISSICFFNSIKNKVFRILPNRYGTIHNPTVTAAKCMPYDFTTLPKYGPVHMYL